MLINSKYNKINKYLKALELSRLESDFITFLEDGNSLAAADIDKFLKLIKFKEHDTFYLEFEKIISPASEEQKPIKKNINKKSSASRVKKYRDITKAKGYKNLSLLLPPDTYQKLKDLKLKNNMTYAELITFLVSNQK